MLTDLLKNTLSPIAVAESVKEYPRNDIANSISLDFGRYLIGIICTIDFLLKRLNEIEK